jgi:hypothetical protein
MEMIYNKRKKRKLLAIIEKQNESSKVVQSMRRRLNFLQGLYDRYLRGTKFAIIRFCKCMLKGSFRDVNFFIFLFHLEPFL